MYQTFQHEPTYKTCYVILVWGIRIYERHSIKNFADKGAPTIFFIRVKGRDDRKRRADDGDAKQLVHNMAEEA